MMYEGRDSESDLASSEQSSEWGSAESIPRTSYLVPHTSHPPAYRLVVLDLDGTLLDSAARLSAGNAAAVAACLAAGVTVALATGKLFVSVRHMVEVLGLGGPQILNNGAVIINAADAALLHMTPLPTSGLHAVIAVLAARGLPIAAYTPHAIYSPAPDPRLAVLQTIHEPPLRIVPSLARDATVDGWPFVKILTVLDQADPATAVHEAALHAAFAPTLTVVRTSPRFYEFLAPGVDKGTAVRWLTARLGLPLTAVLAIGDSYNDLPLLATAGLGIAMANAPPAVQTVAQALTADNDHDGVAQALHRYVLRDGK
jgi:Cof subfamily protein (haloacid dehalogenase superfamily)